MSNSNIEKQIAHNFYIASFKISLNISISSNILGFWIKKDEYFNQIAIVNLLEISNNVRNKVFLNFEEN